MANCILFHLPLDNQDLITLVIRKSRFIDVTFIYICIATQYVLITLCKELGRKSRTVSRKSLNADPASFLTFKVQNLAPQNNNHGSIHKHWHLIEAC